MALAMFDLDDTLVLKNTAGLYFAERFARGQISRFEMAKILWTHLRYKLNLVDMTRVMHEAAVTIVGTSEAEMAEVCAHIYQKTVQPLICPHGRKAVQEHLDKGDTVVIVTASTKYVTDHLAAELKVPHVLCTTLDVQGDTFTGKIVGQPCFGPHKVPAALKFAAEHGFDLKDAYFYSDSHSDEPLLAAVGLPRVVRPDVRLRWHAKKLGWPILPWD